MAEGMNAQVTGGLQAALARVSRATSVVTGKSDVESDLNRGAGPARKASQKTSTSDDEEW